MASPPSLKAVDDWPPLFYKNTFIVWGCPNAENAGRYGAIYDVDKNQWKDMAAAPIERRNWPAAVLAGRRLVIWGGCDDKGVRSDGAIFEIVR